MSSLASNYQQLTNLGVPNGNIVSDEEHTIIGETTMMLSVALGTGSGTLSIDSGGGYIAEDLVEENSEYHLKPCKMKITLTGDATASAS